MFQACVRKEFAMLMQSVHLAMGSFSVSVKRDSRETANTAFPSTPATLIMGAVLQSPLSVNSKAQGR